MGICRSLTVEKKQHRRIGLLANGLEEHGGPFEATVKFLSNYTNHDFIAIRHPLVRNQGSFSVSETKKGNRYETIKYTRPNFPPLTYVLDFLIPLRVSNVDVWITYNPLAAVQARIRTMWKKKTVILWSIDFVPKKSENRIINSFYKLIDLIAHISCTEHWEVSEAALAARKLESGIKKNGAHKVVPMGIWQEAQHGPSRDRFAAKVVVYFGSINERNGVQTLIGLIESADAADQNITFEVVGGGPALGDLFKLKDSLRNQNRLTIHGFVKDPVDAYKILGRCTLAIAPFPKTNSQFTAFADPSKFKAYLAAGLPIVTSSVPPNANELVEKAGAIVVKDSESANEYLVAINTMLENQVEWFKRADSAYTLGSSYLWDTILTEHLMPIIKTLN